MSKNRSKRNEWVQTNVNDILLNGQVTSFACKIKENEQQKEQNIRNIERNHQTVKHE
jgi:hypothetical protein